MTVKSAIRDRFKDCVAQNDYDDITITMICQKTNISRAAFYTYFHSKEEVVRSIVSEDLLLPELQMRDTIDTNAIKSAALILTEMIYTKISSNREFYKKINMVDGGNLLRNAITESFVILNRAVTKDYDLPEDERRISGFFFSAANAALISQWLNDDLDIAPTRLAQLYLKFTRNYFWSVSPYKKDWMQP
jgi:AcrR family transcriptional regulator